MALAYDDEWLANQLRRPGMMNSHQTRNTKSGPIQVKVPFNAPDTLAEGEFNRFYIRALCLRAIDDASVRLVVYRAKSVAQPRPESEAAIGRTMDTHALLADLRANVGWETVLKIGQPNSGLTVKIVRLTP